jgi:hypothetical protein
MSKILWISGGLLLLCSLVAFAVTVEPTEYWLGIACSAMPPALRAQLDLPEKQGVLVEGVVPESPAAKAGIMPHDILLRAGDKALTEPSDLIEAIAATKDGAMKIELLRSGKPTTVEATPAKRPEGARRQVGDMPAPGDREAMEKWMQGMWSGGEGGGNGQRPPMHFRFFHPGAIVPHDVLVPVPLPMNMSIVISKEGDQLAKIVVKRGDEKWELTEKELDKLPADVRPHVERMLGRGPLGIVGGIRPLDFLPEGMAPEASGDQFNTPVPGADLFDRIEKRFDEMNRRMDRMMKQMDELYEGHAHDKAVEK